MKHSMVMATSPQFEYAYRHAPLLFSPVKYDNLALTAASIRLLGELGNSHPTIETEAVAVPTNPVPKLLSEGYAVVLYSGEHQ